MRDISLYLLIVIFFTLSLTSRIAGVYTYWWISIFCPHDWVWGSFMKSLHISLICMVLLIGPCFLQKITPRIKHPIAILIICWLVLVFIADVLNGCDASPITRAVKVSNLFVLFFVVLLTSTLITNYKKLFWLIAVIAASIAFHSGKGGLLALKSGSSYYGMSHLSGLFAGSNAYALGSAMLLFFMIFTFQQINSSLIYERMNKWYNKPFFLLLVKIGIVLLILGTIYNVIALSSRGSFISMIVGLAVWMNLQKKKIKNNLVAVLVIASVLTVVPLPEGYIDRIQSSFNSDENLDKSATSRPHFWQTAEKIVAEHPLGVGPGCFPAYYPLYDSSFGFYGIYRSVHSSHYQILNDSGYLGFILWLLLFLISFWKLVNIRRLSEKLIKDKLKSKFYFDASNMLLCNQTVFLLGGSFYEYAYNDITWLVFGLVIAVEDMFKREINLQQATDS